MQKIKILLLSVALSAAFFIHLPAANVSASSYGINAHLAGNEVLQKIKDAGIKWIRIDINWSAIEKNLGDFNYTDVDRVVNYADANDLSILAILAYTPAWANSNKGINYPADNVYYWKYFVQQTVYRYSSKIKYWVIWNEPNLEEFFALGKDVFVDRIFKPAAEIIRGTDPTAFIVGPGLSHLTSQGREWYFWMTYIFIRCGGDIDIVSHHIYKTQGADYIYQLLEEGENLIPSVKEVIEDSGLGDKPFWITETGWHTNEMSEQGQGDNYLEMLQTRKEKNYPQKLFFYEIIDDPTPGINPFGILRSNLGEKVAYTVYKDFIAGKYDDGGGGDDGGGDDSGNKCTTKEAASSASGNNTRMLSGLRGFRDFLRAYSPAAGKLTQLYYRLSGEFVNLSNHDSRILRLGRQLVNDSYLLVKENLAAVLNKSLEKTTLAKAGQLLALLKEKNLSAAFRNMVLWAEKQLDFLGRATIGGYLSHHLDREMCVLE